jgi:hypothetical protein
VVTRNVPLDGQLVVVYSCQWGTRCDFPGPIEVQAAGGTPVAGEQHAGSRYRPCSASTFVIVEPAAIEPEFGSVLVPPLLERSGKTAIEHSTTSS